LALNENTDLKAAVTYYNVNTKGKTLTHPGTGNTMAGDSQRYDYDSVSPAFELGFDNPLGILPYASLTGEYIHALKPEKNENGFIAGFKVGNKDIKEFGNWQFGYYYRRLEADCWLDALPNSDTYSGDTNTKGHTWFLGYGLGKNALFNLTCYYAQPIKNINSMSTEAKQIVVQSDFIVKF
ncbi:MAG: putative porin, partial [Candidatus Omnitrophota bacterium]